MRAYRNGAAGAFPRHRNTPLFRIENGLIRQIEAILERVPYGMPSGWSSWEDAMSDRIQWDGL